MRKVTMMKLEVVLVPVADVDRALGFYRDQMGFTLDVDYAPTSAFRVVQLTPPDSVTSIQFGTGVTDMAPGSLRGTYLVVTDLAAAREDLLARDVHVGKIRHKDTSSGQWGGAFLPGLDPDRGDYASLAEVIDPDGNTWTLQEVGH
jgi:catechol 2,3-dioxygenase-like lactoylglutathione lyase family enzyme